MSRPPDLVVDIAALGVGGDGIAETGSGPVYVPYAVPGDRLGIRVRREKGSVRRGDIVTRLIDGPGRIEPVCSHFADSSRSRARPIATGRGVWLSRLLNGAASMSDSLATCCRAISDGGGAPGSLCR